MGAVLDAPSPYLDDAAPHKFKKALGASSEVDSGIVSLFEFLTEKPPMKFSKFGPFVPVRAGKSAEVGCLAHRADAVLPAERGIEVGTKELGRDDVLVVLKIVGHKHIRFFSARPQSLEDALQ